MVFNFNILQEMEESLDRGITDLVPVAPPPVRPAPVLQLAPAPSAPAKPQKIERRRITDTAPSLLTMGRKPRPSPEDPETTLVQPDSFISTEGLTYTPLPVANQFIIETLFA